MKKTTTKKDCPTYVAESYGRRRGLEALAQLRRRRAHGIEGRERLHAAPEHRPHRRGEEGDDDGGGDALSEHLDEVAAEVRQVVPGTNAKSKSVVWCGTKVLPSETPDDGWTVECESRTAKRYPGRRSVWRGLRLQCHPQKHQTTKYSV